MGDLTTATDYLPMYKMVGLVQDDSLHQILAIVYSGLKRAYVAYQCPGPYRRIPEMTRDGRFWTILVAFLPFL